MEQLRNHAIIPMLISLALFVKGATGNKIKSIHQLLAAYSFKVAPSHWVNIKDCFSISDRNSFYTRSTLGQRVLVASPILFQFEYFQFIPMGLRCLMLYHATLDICFHKIQVRLISSSWDIWADLKVWTRRHWAYIHRHNWFSKQFCKFFSFYAC